MFDWLSVVININLFGVPFQFIESIVLYSISRKNDPIYGKIGSKNPNVSKPTKINSE